MTHKIISREEALATDVTKYFTGIPCKKGHVGFRYTAHFNCVICHRDRAREWAKNNLDKARINWKKSSARNAEQKRCHRAKLRTENPARVREQKDTWRKANPELFATQLRNRRARLMGAGKRHTKNDVNDLMILQDGKCVYCRLSIRKSFHVDHILPLSLGGDNDRTNLQLLCVSCNTSKRGMHPVEYAKRRGFLL